MPESQSEKQKQTKNTPKPNAPKTMTPEQPVLEEPLISESQNVEEDRWAPQKDLEETQEIRTNAGTANQPLGGEPEKSSLGSESANLNLAENFVKHSTGFSERIPAGVQDAMENVEDSGITPLDDRLESIEDQKRFLGMTPFQRFLVTLLIFLVILVYGVFFLLMTGRIEIPFF